MTPDEKERTAAIARIAYFALGGTLATVDREQRAKIIKLVELVSEQCEALGVRSEAQQLGSDETREALLEVARAAGATVLEVGEPVEDPCAELTRLSQEMGLYDAPPPPHCDMCKGPCEVLKPEQVKRDMQRIHKIIDYVLTVDQHATIHLGRGLKDHEFSVQVEVDDPNTAERINRSRELNQPGMWTGCSERG